ncbi:uncharacterized protein LOC131595758 [Vicia villosa]|uniref:uncharacterized protein LOC131595758 n=1 Tax=Vicia villosa TaxID=3911 RepID=UPI00273B0082|nr:uncharacterized protein LOC131595758 [Vicia villosa]
MEADMKKSGTWIMKHILLLRETVNNIQKLWNIMCIQGKFKMKNVYNHMVKVTACDWHNRMMNNPERPRAVLVMWLVCHKKLATKERLHRFGMLNSSFYFFCPNIGTIDHLFYECTKLKSIWIDVLDWLHFSHVPKNWKEELVWILEQSKGKGWKASLLKLAATETIYNALRF